MLLQAHQSAGKYNISPALISTRRGLLKWEKEVRRSIGWSGSHVAHGMVSLGMSGTSISFPFRESVPRWLYRESFVGLTDADPDSGSKAYVAASTSSSCMHATSTGGIRMKCLDPIIWQ